MEKKLYSLRGGLKKARKRKGIKQSDLADLMGVTLKTVMNWEQGIVNPDFETVVKLADKLECDIDYLTGRLPESTHDIHFVHEFTGLSEKAIRKIHCQKLDNPFGKILSHLIEAENFENLMTAYKTFLLSAEKLSKSEIKVVDLEIDENNRITLGLNEATHLFMHKTTLAMSHICDEDYLKSYEQASKNTQKGFIQDYFDSVLQETRKEPNDN